MPNFFASSGNEILITSVVEPNGWLSNMSPHPIVYEGVRWRTSEALFQAMRLENPEVREAIRQVASPMIAKNIARGYRGLRVVEATSPQDVENMRVCISLKLEQQKELLRRKLFFTGNSKIIEDCSSRDIRGNDLFWGAKRVEGGWEGDNWLGRIWEEMRAPLQIKMAAEWGAAM